MSDQKTPSESAPAEQREQRPQASSGQTQADDGNAGGGSDKKAEDTARPPNQLRSHYKGMPKQWEKNKDKFPPKDA
ncbi:hypothetical protein F5X99DRAFT_67399 [Biscogniauxia marginata]|nr:hypothetical protein F5X99DRAFT_67399 [Biscogniauxia marginata]